VPAGYQQHEACASTPHQSCYPRAVETVAFLETTGDRHAQLIAGVTALERRVRDVAKAGATRAIVAAAPLAMPRPLPIPVEFVAPGSAPPEGAQRERADVIAGIELVDDDARRKAEWALIRRMNKSYEGPVDALINWRFSMRITRVLSRRSLAVTPNHVTIAAILVGIVASYVASLGAWWSFAVGGVLLEINSILDSVDGELARLRFQYSKLGQWLDNLSDDIVDNLFLVAVGYGIGGDWLYLGLAAAGGRLLVSITTYVIVYASTGTGNIFAFRWWFERGEKTVDELYKPTSIGTWLRSFGRRDTFVFVWMIACIANFPYWVIGHGLLIAAVNVTILLLHFTVFRKAR
jgi:phosphatidylglycerophosphate synthase